MLRRHFLRALSTAACSAAAHPWLTTVTLAGADGGPRLGENRLIVVILRGAMDGLDLVRPEFDPAYRRLRPGLALPGLPLSQGFALSPRLSALMPLWQAGELGFVHATSTPYRDKRSHFDGQDILEAGTGLDLPDPAVRDGWLNRMLQAVPGLRSETAFAVGRDAIPLLAGAAPVMNWTPDLTLSLSAQGRLLLDHVYHDDPLFRDAAAEAMMLADQASDMDALEAEADIPDEMTGAEKTEAGMAPPANRQLAGIDDLADFAAQRLRAETRIAAFSLTGWDTHRNQAGGIAGPLARLERVILRLREGLGPGVWGKTVLLAMTEFGRTVAENGSKGTDHGTGGAMLMAGGALRGGRVLGQWPGLAEEALYARRDLMPTSDVRGWAGAALRGLYGFDRALIEGTVFPGLILPDDPGLLR